MLKVKCILNFERDRYNDYSNRKIGSCLVVDVFEQFISIFVASVELEFSESNVLMGNKHNKNKKSIN